MAEVPENWGLEKRPRADGRLDLVGKADDGSEYVARTTEGAGVTESDISALRRGDREAYDGDRDKACRQLVEGFVAEAKANKQDWENKMLDDYIEAALPVAEAGCGHKAFGLNDAYARGEVYFEWKKRLGI